MLEQIQWHDLAVAVALVMVLEGIFPFINPKVWRKMFAEIVALSNSTVRIMGLISMLAGLLLLFMIKS